jgi:4-amino-4-deoxy-L-arabinose transferase-like glycosyltransferase
VAITLRTGGGFWAASLGRDLLGKVATGRESFGEPPGFYLATLWLTFWPGAVILALALPAIVAGWRRRESLFCLAWIVPFWALFEAFPTKLVHYTLPTFPALAILAAAGFLATAEPLGRIWRKLAAGLVLAVPFAVLALAGWALAGLGAALPWPIVLAAGLLSLAAVGLVRALARGLHHAALAWLAALSFAFALGVYPGLIRVPLLWPSAAVAAAVAGFDGCPGPRLVAAGYREPSLVFQTSREIVLADGRGAAAAVAAAPCALAFVAPDQRAAFDAALAAAGVRMAAAGRIEGLNLGSGRRVTLDVLARTP